MTEIEILKRKILLKRQLIQWTQEDIAEMEKKVKEMEEDEPATCNR